MRSKSDKYYSSSLSSYSGDNFFYSYIIVEEEEDMFSDKEMSSDYSIDKLDILDC